MNAQREGLLATHAAVMLFGVTALFSKLIALPAVTITPLRSAFAVLALWLFILLRHESLALQQSRDYLWSLLLGVLMALHWVTFFHAMQVSTVAIGVIALYTYPVITVFLEPLFEAGRPRLHDVFSALLVILGVYLIIPAFAVDNEVFLGVAWGLCSALLFSLRNIIQRRRLAQYSAQQTLFYQVLVIVLVLLPFSPIPVTDVSSWQWTQLIILGVFFTALPHSLFMHGLRVLKAKTVSLIACLQIMHASLFAALLLGEWPDMNVVQGGLIVFLVAVYESYFAGRDSATGYTGAPAKK